MATKLGALKSGAAYAPMDAVLFPPERIKFIARIRMKLILTVEKYVDVVEGDFEKLLVEEVMKKRLDDEVYLEHDVRPTDCAYMIYTNVSTGVPKGLVCHHLGPVNMSIMSLGFKYSARMRCSTHIRHVCVWMLSRARGMILL